MEWFHRINIALDCTPIVQCHKSYLDFQTVHRVLNYKLIKKELTEGSDPDIVAFAKDVAAKMCTAEAFAENYYAFTRKAMYSFDNIDKLPQSKVFR